jgi:hypothetical protein
MCISSSRRSQQRKKAIGINLFRVTPGFYTITGVGFIDKVHGQLGHADNGIEIHPVFSVEQAP